MEYDLQLVTESAVKVGGFVGGVISVKFCTAQKRLSQPLSLTRPTPCRLSGLRETPLCRAR